MTADCDILLIHMFLIQIHITNKFSENRCYLLFLTLLLTNLLSMRPC